MNQVLTKEQVEMMEKIFARYHRYDRIDPTDDFVAQACFDIGWLQGLVSGLCDRIKNLPPS